MLLLFSSPHMISITHALLYACSSRNEFGTCNTMCINTNVFLISLRDIGSTPFDNDALVGKASETSREITYEY